ncbi:uncharacterized protein BDZ99DRAFT_401411, partial [Mytilinidion resinicola]
EPISLLELGLFAASGKLVVCYPKNFWRKGNVQVMARKYGFPLLETYEKFILVVKERLERQRKGNFRTVFSF